MGTKSRNYEVFKQCKKLTSQSNDFDGYNFNPNFYRNVVTARF